MDWYPVCIVLHLLAAFLWLGHMFIWSLFAMPALKRVEPAALADLLRERALYLGGLGWPALLVLIPTGSYMLAARGSPTADNWNKLGTALIDGASWIRRRSLSARRSPPTSRPRTPTTSSAGSSPSAATPRGPPTSFRRTSN